MNGAGTPGESRPNFEFMLGGLLVLLLVGPLLRTFEPQWTQAVLWITTGIAMAAVAWALVRGIGARTLGCVVGAGFAVCGLLGTRLGLPMLHVVAATGLLLFCLWGIVSGLRQVLIGPDVDLNRIAGSVCVYILMGLSWASLYLLIAMFDSQSFNGLAGHGVDELWPRLTYFSFVTLTTLGYGDISPAVPVAKSLAYLEAVVGQLYIAILIAGLVGAHLNSRNR